MLMRLNGDIEYSENLPYERETEMVEIENLTEEWERLGDPVPISLSNARLQLHWASQIVAAVGTTYLEPLPDDSHPAMSWDREARALVGHSVGSAPGFQAGLRLADMVLFLRDDEGNEISQFGLNEQTLAEGYGWLGNAISSYRGTSEFLPIVPPGYDIPEHPVGLDADFQLSDGQDFEELARWFFDADLVLRALGAEHGATVLCWPHHFDIAILIEVEGGDDPEQKASIGVGLSPGDSSYNQPYWYVSPSPVKDDQSELPDLGGEGRWHRKGWFGAVLTGTRLSSYVTSEDQAEVFGEYLSAALSAADRLLE